MFDSVFVSVSVCKYVDTDCILTWLQQVVCLLCEHVEFLDNSDIPHCSSSHNDKTKSFIAVVLTNMVSDVCPSTKLAGTGCLFIVQCLITCLVNWTHGPEPALSG